MIMTYAKPGDRATNGIGWSNRGHINYIILHFSRILGKERIGNNQSKLNRASRSSSLIPGKGDGGRLGIPDSCSEGRSRDDAASRASREFTERVLVGVVVVG